MIPTLAPGDRVLVARRLVRTSPARLEPGDLVVFRDPELASRLLVKRIDALDRAGLVVRGDNAAASRDSRQFGVVTHTLVLGRPWYRYRPAASAGRLGRPSGNHR